MVYVPATVPAFGVNVAVHVIVAFGSITLTVPPVLFVTYT
jgi:hypothetical protein